MLQEQQRVGDFAGRARRDQVVLPRPGGAVVDAAQPLDAELHARTIAASTLAPSARQAWVVRGLRSA